MERIGPYEVLTPIGAGGMGAIYKARDTRDERVVALKLLHTYFLKNEDTVRRFQNEAKAYMTLNHPNILRMYDCNRTPDAFYFAVEYLEGRSLADYIKTRTDDIPEAAIRKIFQQICEAMAYAHGQGVLHRDLTAGNVIVGEDLHVTVIDLGLSKLASEMTMTLTGTVIGTPAYMAPEQFVSMKDVDERSDI